MSIERKIKICFVATYTYALFHRDQGNLPITGLDVQLYNWAVAFARDSRYDVNFVVGDFGQPKKELIDGVTLWRSSRPKKRGVFEGLYSFITLILVLKRIKADIYIDRGASGPISFELAMISKFYRGKYVHMVASDADVDDRYREKNGILLNTLHSLALRFSDGVTYQNSYQEIFLKKLKVRAWKIQNSFPIKQKVEVRRDFVLWVGSSYDLKRPQVFLDLAKTFPQEKFVLILQRHDQDVFLEIEERAKKIKNILFIPGISLNEIDSFFARAKVFVNTSIYEGFPNTFVQAAMYSVPVLSLKVDPDFILRKNKIGVSCDDDIDIFTVEFSKMLGHDGEWDTLSKNARSFALRHFNIRKNIVAFKKLFVEILC